MACEVISYSCFLGQREQWITHFPFFFCLLRSAECEHMCKGNKLVLASCCIVMKTLQALSARQSTVQRLLFMCITSLFALTDTPSTRSALNSAMWLHSCG